MSLRNLLLQSVLEQVAELVAVMSQPNELQRQLHAMPHGDAKRELIGPRVYAFNLANAEEREGKGTRVSVRRDKGNEAVREGQLACPCAVARRGRGKIELTGDVCLNVFCLREVEEGAEQVVSRRLGFGHLRLSRIDELVDEWHRRLAQELQRRCHPAMSSFRPSSLTSPMQFRSFNSSNDTSGKRVLVCVRSRLQPR